MDDATLRGLAIELGIGAGYGQTYAPEGYSNIDSQKSDTSATLLAFLQARNKIFGGEVGYMKLPEYHSKSHTSDYPAYKHLPAGTYPQTVDGQQDITARGRYARANAYGPTMGGVEPYAFLGKMRVSSDNHEHATYDGKDEADLRQKLTKNAPYYGIGAQTNIGKNWNLRGEYSEVPHATVDYHTLDRKIRMFNLGLGYQF